MFKPMFRARQISNGPPRPGTIAVVEVRVLTQVGKVFLNQNKWAVINVVTTSEKRGGLQLAEQQAKDMNLAHILMYTAP